MNDKGLLKEAIKKMAAVHMVDHEGKDREKLRENMKATVMGCMSRQRTSTSEC